MSRWDHRYLGHERFPASLSAFEVEQFFTLSKDELASVRERRGPRNRLALALQIGFLKMTGGTLNSVEIIPAAVLDHLGRQLAYPPPRSAPSTGASARCSTIRRPPWRCSAAASSRHMPSAAWWLTCAGKLPPCSTVPS
jgi:Domain of unknown function (DUF4158)